VSLDAFERTIAVVAQAGRLGLELVAVTVVLWGGVAVALRALRGVASRRPVRFNALRLDLARYLALGLEFQLGADIVGTRSRRTGSASASWARSPSFAPR
jgi:uncharacterized membrane protein